MIMTILNIKSVWKWEINIIFQMLIGKYVTHFSEINKCSFVCLCVSVRLCLSFYNFIHGLQKTNIGIFLSGNLDFGLEKSWKNHGTFFWDFCGNPVKYMYLYAHIVHIHSQINSLVPGRLRYFGPSRNVQHSISVLYTDLGRPSGVTP